MFVCRRILCAGLFVLAMLASFCSAPAQVVSSAAQVTAAENVWALMTVWHEVKTHFVFRDRLGEWDQQVRQAIPEVSAAADVPALYAVLRRLAASLGNGHTQVITPPSMWATTGTPPLEIQFIEDRFIIARVAEKHELREQNVVPGLEIVEIEGRPARQYMETETLPFVAHSTPQQAYAAGLFHLLTGPVRTRVSLVLADTVGRRQTVSITRDARMDDSSFFYWRMNEMPDAPQTRRLEGGIGYVQLSTFQVPYPQLVDKFTSVLHEMDADNLRGMIVDIRYNGGGNGETAYGIIRRLIAQPVLTPRWRTREIVPAELAWGLAERWSEQAPDTLWPDSGVTFAGPLVLLVGAHTTSAAEDFAVVLHANKRAVLVGEKTAGDTGQIKQVGLPYGGYLWVCTKWDFYPDGREFVGGGIVPDLAAQPTAADILAGRDPALATAVRVLNDWENHRPK